MRTDKILIVLFLVFLCYSCKNSNQATLKNEESQRPPNIIFIMADDHAIQAISAYGHPISKLAPTPNIDRLAQNGALFTQSFCTNSICGPSRAVILTGKHSHINGFRQNGDHFNGGQPTLPKLLKKQNYQTAVIGKWHLHGKPQGFDYWNILNDQGNYYNPEFIQESDTTIAKGYATDLITEYSLDWIKENSKAEKPFFLMVHHKAPHRNWMPALRHLNKYDSITFPLPESYFSVHEGQKAAQQQQQTIYKDMYEGHDLKITKAYGSTELAHNPWTKDFDRMTLEQRAKWDSAYLTKNNNFHQKKLKSKDLANWKGQRYLQDYMATIASVDEGVGSILNYLEETGLDKNTLVVYTSDQGFYLGEKGFFDKRFMYEESLRMPLLMQLPGKITSRSKINALVQNLDFAPTFLELAEASEETDDMQGKSFLGVLNGIENAEDFRDAIYYHYYDYPAFHMVKKHYGVRTKRYKLMHFYDDIDSWEFYDLKVDPNEEYNAIEDESYNEVRKEMYAKLDSLQKHYKITSKEFKKAPSHKVEKAYGDFKRLRGYPIKTSID